MKTRYYKLAWYIDVWQPTPFDAAAEALAIQRDPESTASIFTVWPDDGPPVCIDALTGDTLPSDYAPDRAAMQEIAAALSGKEWTSDTLAEVAEIVRRAGFDIAEPA